MRSVATVAGRPIPITRLEARVAQVRRGRRGRHLPPEGGAESQRIHRWIVQELVTEAVLIHEAGGARVDGAQASEEATRIALVARAELFDRVTRRVRVTERELRAYYRANRDLYREREARRVRHLLIRGRPPIPPAARSRLNAEGTELELRRGELTGPFEEAVFAARPGEVIGPIRSELGWHVARLEAVTPERSVPYAQVRSSIRAVLLAAARTRAFDAWLDERRRELVVIEPAFEHPDHPVHGTPRHRH